jgi:hypothetical protein
MANCDVNALLNDARCFSCLSERQLEIVMAQLLVQWSGNTDSTEQLLSDAREFIFLDTKKLEQIQAQLLCNIAG